MELERLKCGLVEVKRAGDEGSFSGYGAVFGNVDAYGDVIEPGAFKDTLGAWQKRGKLPKMLLQHGGMGIGAEDMLPLGKWTSMKEDSHGLKVEGYLLAMDTERSKKVYAGLTSGELDSLSIGFQTDDAYDVVKDGVTLRHLTKLNLWEVSPVTFPANDQALISDVKAFTPEQLRELEDVLRDGGLSRTDSKTAVSIFRKHVLREAGKPGITPRDEVVPEVDAEAAEILKALSSRTAGLWAEVFKH